MNVNRINCYALATLCLLSSCKEEVKDEMKNEEAPTINITSPKADTKVWLEVTLAADVIDNQGVSKVEFYLDGDLIGEDTEAPYEMSLDTKQYDDGTHVLRTVAYNKANNHSETTRDIEIQNALLTIDVESNHFGRARSSYKWVIVSDLRGNTLQTEEVKNGGMYYFDRDGGFLDSLISVTIVRVDEHAFKSVYAITYYGIQPSKWVFKDDYQNDTTEPTKLGEANGSFTYNNNGGDFKLYSPYAEGWVYETNRVATEDGVMVNFRVDLFKNTARTYVATFPDGKVPQYILLTVEAGGNYTIAANNFADMKLVKTVSLPSSIHTASAQVHSSYADGSFYLSESSLDEKTNTISTYQPEDLFSSFLYKFSASSNTFYYQRSEQGQLPSDFNVPSSIEYSVLNPDRSNFKAITEYSRDYSVVGWFEIDNGEFDHAAWDVYTTGQDTMSFSIPSIPKVITDKYPTLEEKMSNLPYSNTRLVNLSSISSFKEYATSLYQRDGEAPKASEFAIIYRSDDNGRKSLQALPPHVQDEIKNTD